MSVLEQLRQYKTGTVCDGLDAQGLPDQALPPDYRMLCVPKGGRFVGRAKPLNVEMLPTDKRVIGKVPLAASIAMQKRLEAYVQPGTVVVFGMHGPQTYFECVGGFIATLFQQSGAIGILADGYIRDAEEITAANMGVVCKGVHPAIMRGRAMYKQPLGEPTTLGGVTVRENDIILADSDGTLVIPNDEAMIEKLLAWLANTAELEKKAWADVARGDKISDIFSRYGVL